VLYNLLHITVLSISGASTSSCQPVLTMQKGIMRNNEEEQKLAQAFQRKLQEVEQAHRRRCQIQELQQVDFERGKMMCKDYREILQNTKQPLEERIQCCEALLCDFFIVRECFEEEIAELKKDPEYLAGQFISSEIGSLYRFRVDKLQTFSYRKHYACLINTLLKKLQNAMSKKSNNVCNSPSLC
jgi:hypothetical protein